MKIKLVRLKDNRTSDVLDFPIVENIGLGYLGSTLKAKGYDAEILDEEIQDITRNETLEKLKEADLIGFTATARPQIYSVIDVSNELRKRGYGGHITAGGHFPTFMFRELLENSNLDSIVLYEGEETLSELAEAVEKGKDLGGVLGLAFKDKGETKKNHLRPLVHNLDSLPSPSRDLSGEIIEKGGLSVISSSRGCYNRCSYCTISSFYSDPPGDRFRLRSAENVSEELRELKKRFPNLRDIWFVDDNFVQKGEQGYERTSKICKTLKQLGLKFDIYLRADDVNDRVLRIMKESGLRSVFIGAEAGTNKTLKEIFRKRTGVEQTKHAIKLCKEFGINVDPGFIMFHPWSTMDEIGENIAFLKGIEEYTPYGIASFLTAYKFTPIGLEMQSEKRAYKPARTKTKDPLQDDVPYEIEDPKAELLLDLTLKAFQGFSQLPKSLRKLKSKARKENNQELLKNHAQRINGFSRASMHYFERLYSFLRRDGLNGVKDFFERVSREIEDYTSREVSDIEKILAS